MFSYLKCLQMLRFTTILYTVLSFFELMIFLKKNREHSEKQLAIRSKEKDDDAVKVHLMKARHLHRLVRLQHPRQVVAVVQKMKWLIEAK